MERPFSSNELKRYSRHLVMAEVGNDGQQRFRNASVLVVGAGGLGSPVILYLAAAGIGRIGIVDDDVVELSNLQRQVLFSTTDVGKLKALIAQDKIKKLNPNLEANAIPERLTSGNALDILVSYDAIIDATDNFATRYLINDACVLLNKPFVFGSILKFEGHISVFNHLRKDGTRSCTYRDVFPLPPNAASAPNCAEAGVIGVLPGIIGALQANEVLKMVGGFGDVLTDKLLIFDALTLEQTIINLADRGARHSVKELIDYEDFCGISQEKSKYLAGNQLNVMKEITVQELKKMKELGADFQLIDVREPHEYDICNLDGELIPMSEIPYNVDRIAKDKQVVIHCRSGKRSGDMLLWLEKNHGFDNLYNLKGGVLAWAKEIDPSMPTY